jgi:Bacterial Ig-like domain (group 3)/FG-GAP-like repeat
VRAVVGFLCLIALLGSPACPEKNELSNPKPSDLMASIFAAFFGLDPPAADAPASPASPFFAFLHRESSCSLTRYATDGQFNILSTFPNYQDYLHKGLQLATTPDVFPNGCKFATTGIASQVGAYLGQTTTGNFAGALLINSGFQVFVVSPGGLVVSGPTVFSTTGAPGPNNSAVAAGLSTADLNGDGIADLVVASTGFSPPNVGTLTVYLGKGDGTFQAPVTIGLSIPATGVTIDDVNGDGKLDLVATSLLGSGTTGINVLLGDGKGNFGVPIPGPPNASGITAAVGDFNGDGKKDIVTTTGQVLLGNNDGTFTLQPAVLINPSISNSGGPGVVGVTAGDFNNDGKLDLAFSNQNAVTMDIYLGKGDGTFAYSHSYAATFGADTLNVTDLDGDGNQDIFLGTNTGTVFAADGQSNGFFQSFLGHGDGSFAGANAYIPLGAGAQGINFFAVADFNGDEKPDIATIDIDNSNGPYLSMQLGNGDGTFKTQPPMPLTGDFNSASSVEGFLAADVDGDGKSDIIFAHTNNLQQPIVSVLIGKGNGTFAAQVDYNVAAPVVALASLDLNGDKKPDLVFIANPGNSFPPTATVLYVMLNNGDGTFAVPVLADTKPYLGSLAVGDVNGDGSPDLVATAAGDLSNGVAGATYLYLNKGNGTLPAAQTLDGGMFPGAAAIADMNHDGKMDIVVSGTATITTGYVEVLINNGGGSFAPAQPAATDDAFPASVAVADLESDGKPDVVLSGCCGLAFSYFLQGNGDGTFSTNASDLSLAVSTTQVKLVDVNNDGVPDFLTVANGLALEVFLNTFKSQTVTTATNTALMGSPASITVGQSETFTATVTQQSGSGRPAGTVTFFDGTTALGTSTLNSSGVAILATTTLTQGTHSVTATYGGDVNFTSSASNAVSVQVNASALISTTTSLTGPATAAQGATVTCTAKVIPASGAAKPTGMVTFLDKTAPLMTVTLDSTGAASFSTSALSLGSHLISVQYAGDTNFAGSTSNVVAIMVAAGPLISTTTALTGPATAASGESVGLMASVTPASGATKPTGTVTFLEGGTTLGSGVLDASGAATFSTTTLSTGSHSITAQYSGDTKFASSASLALSITITGTLRFGLTASPSSVAVTRKHGGVTTITASPVSTGAMARGRMPLDASGQTIQFSCANLPAGISCAFAPASLTLNDSPVTTQLTISEGATIAALGGKSSSGLGGMFDRGDGLEVRTGVQTVFIPALCCEMFLLAGLWRRSNLGRACAPVGVAYAAVLLLTVATFLGGCSNPPPQPTTTTVTINAAVGTQVVLLPLNVTIQN